MTERLNGQRHLFDLPDDVAYLNLASLAPQLHSVRRAGEGALDSRAAPWAVRSADWFTDAERLRGLFATVVGGDADGVALVPATSYGLAVAAFNSPPRAGARVLVTVDEYPSTVYTWRAFAERTQGEVVMVAPVEGESWTDAVLGALDERVHVVSVPNVRGRTGR
jgi:selenocysteine lyase/cysteine desulfurase